MVVIPRRRVNPRPQTCDPSMATYLALIRVCRQLYRDLVHVSFIYRHKLVGFSGSTLLANYLKTINLAHRAAITAIHLCLPLPVQPAPHSPIPLKKPRLLSRAAILSLRSLSSLRFLKLEIVADRFLQIFYAASPYAPPPTTIRADVLKNITESKHIRSKYVLLFV